MRVQKFIDLINGACKFIEEFDDQSEDLQQIWSTIYGWWFSITVGLKMFGVFQFIIAVTIYTDYQLNTLEFYLIVFPHIIMSILFIEFFLGILFFWFYATKIKQKVHIIFLKQINLEGQIGNVEDLQLSLQIADELDVLAATYEQFYNVFQQFHNFFSMMMTYLLLHAFQTTIFILFFDMNILVDYFMNIQANNVFEVLAIGVVILAITSVEFGLYFQAAHNCTKEVRFKVLNIFNKICIIWRSMK